MNKIIALVVLILLPSVLVGSSKVVWPFASMPEDVKKLYNKLDKVQSQIREIEQQNILPGSLADIAAYGVELPDLSDSKEYQELLTEEREIQQKLVDEMRKFRRR